MPRSVVVDLGHFLVQPAHRGVLVVGLTSSQRLLPSSDSSNPSTKVCWGWSRENSRSSLVARIGPRVVWRREPKRTAVRAHRLRPHEAPLFMRVPLAESSPAALSRVQHPLIVEGVPAFCQQRKFGTMIQVQQSGLTMWLAISVGLMGCYESFSPDRPPHAGCTDFRVVSGPPHECGERVVGTGCRPCSEAANRALEECPDHNLECVRALAIDDADVEACSVCIASNTVACINRRADCDEVWAQAACCMEASCAGSHIYEAPTTANLSCWDFECASQIASWNECFDDELREACVEVAAAQCTR